MSELIPFEVQVPDEVLEDLRRRLVNTRWPNEPRSAGWAYGTNMAYLKKLVDYWQKNFDWRAAEARINRFPQFTTDAAYDSDVAGSGSITLHFIREPGSGPGPPLLLLHGWPGSIAEFLDFIEPLAHPERFGGDPEDGFEVIAPSLPGYGFSGAPSAPMGPRAAARLLETFMTENLGYEHFLVQGGDWGSIIGTHLAVIAPSAVRALHVNAVPIRPYLGPEVAPLSSEEERWLEEARARRSHETGYQAIQGTRSQTLAYGQADSPVGLAAWIVEKFHVWTDPDRAEPPFSMDDLLTNIMIYWVTNSANTATWLYRGIREEGAFALELGREVKPPLGLCLPPNDLFPPPPSSWIARLGNVVHETRLPSGGHFTALEKGTELLADIRKFFREHASPD